MLGGTQTGLSPWPHVEGVTPAGWSHNHPSWGHLLELGNEGALGAVGSPGPGKSGPWCLVALATAGLWVPVTRSGGGFVDHGIGCLGAGVVGGEGEEQGGGCRRPGGRQLPLCSLASSCMLGRRGGNGQVGALSRQPPVGAGAGRPSQVGRVGAAGGSGLRSAAPRESCLSVGEAGAWGRGHPSTPGPELVLRVGPSRGVAPPGPGSWTLRQHLPKQPAQEVGAWSRCLSRWGEACP